MVSPYDSYSVTRVLLKWLSSAKHMLSAISAFVQIRSNL